MNLKESLSRRPPIFDTNPIIPMSLLTARSLLWVATLLTFLFPYDSWGQTLAPHAAQAPKNIVILLADDLGWGDVGFHGGIASTPNLDQLAKESVELTRFSPTLLAVPPAPLCLPADSLNALELSAPSALVNKACPPTKFCYRHHSKPCLLYTSPSPRD